MSQKKIIEKKLLKNVGVLSSDKGKKSKFGHFIITSLKVFCILILLAILGVSILASAIIAQYSRNLPSVQQVFARSAPETTQIYAGDGTLLASVYDKENRIYEPLSQIPKQMQWAVLAAEDVEFFQEDTGINIKSIARAAIYDVSHKDTGSLQGASTITQELVKDTVLTQNQTLGRKIQEIIITLRISQKYTKEDILQAYLNKVGFGGSNYGVEAAAQFYFGKDVGQLDLAQCALLAGLLQAPSIYSPLVGSEPNLAQVRQRYVLNQMLIHKDLTGVTQDEITQAENETLVYNTNPVQPQLQAPQFVYYIEQLLKNQYGDNLVNNGGLKVYTSINLHDQQLATKAVQEGVAKELAQGQNAHNASLVSIDPSTGEVLAMVGSVNYSDTSKKVSGNVNMATSHISPGSSVKPFVYTLAFQNLGYTPKTIVPDIKKTFAGGYTPMDWDYKFEGEIPVKTAVLNSRNIPAVDTGNKLGLSSMYAMFQNLDITGLGPIDNYGLSFAIGAADISLLDFTNAYTIFPNDGYEYPLRPILKIYDKFGKLVEDNTSNKPRLIFQSYYIKEMNSILVNYSTLSPVRSAGYSVAGKTGTSQNNADLLFMGYSANLVTGVWAGNTDNSPTTSNSWGESVAAPIWNQYMLSVLPQYTKKQIDTNF